MLLSSSTSPFPRAATHALSWASGSTYNSKFSTPIFRLLYEHRDTREKASELTRRFGYERSQQPMRGHISGRTSARCKFCVVHKYPSRPPARVSVHRRTAVDHITLKYGARGTQKRGAT